MRGLVDQYHEAHHVSFYTIASIIQGAALAYLMFNRTEHLLSLNLEAVATVVLLIIILNEYIRGTALVSYFPRISDVIVAVGIGVLEVGLIKAIGRTDEWFLWLALIAVGAAIAHLDMLFWARKDTANAAVLERFGSRVHLLMIASLATAMVAWGASMWREVPSIAALLLMGVYMIGSAIIWGPVVRSVQGGSEKDRSEITNTALPRIERRLAYMC